MKLWRAAFPRREVSCQVPVRGGVPLGWDPSTSPHVGELSHWRGLSIVGAHPEDLRCKRRERHPKELSPRNSASIFHPSGRKLGGLSSVIDHTWETAGWLYCHESCTGPPEG